MRREAVQRNNNRDNREMIWIFLIRRSFELTRTFCTLLIFVFLIDVSQKKVNKVFPTFSLCLGLFNQILLLLLTLYLPERSEWHTLVFLFFVKIEFLSQCILIASSLSFSTFVLSLMCPRLSGWVSSFSSNSTNDKSCVLFFIDVFVWFPAQCIHQLGQKLYNTERFLWWKIPTSNQQTVHFRQNPLVIAIRCCQNLLIREILLFMAVR